MLYDLYNIPPGGLPCHREETCFSKIRSPQASQWMRAAGIGSEPCRVRTAFWMGDPILPGLRALSQPPTASPAYQRRLQRLPPPLACAPPGLPSLGQPDGGTGSPAILPSALPESAPGHCMGMQVGTLQPREGKMVLTASRPVLPLPLCLDLQLLLPFAQHSSQSTSRRHCPDACAGWALWGSSALLPLAQGIWGYIGGVGVIS